MEKKPLGEILLEIEIITEDQLKQALEYQTTHDCRFGKALIDLGFATKEDIFKALVMQYGYPYVELSQLSVTPQVLERIPAEIALKYNLVPIDFDEETKRVRVVMAPPFELSIVKSLEREIGLGIEFALTTPEQVREALRYYYYESA